MPGPASGTFAMELLRLTVLGDTLKFNQQPYLAEGRDSKWSLFDMKMS